MSAIIAPVPANRRRTDKIMRGVLLAGTLIALVPLALVVYYLLKQGLGALSWDFFTTDPTGRFLGPPGGVKSAIVGTILIVGLASLIAVPAGIGVALFLVEYGKKSVFANLVRYFVDVMTGVPSIVFGLFIYIVLVLTGIGGNFTAWKGSVALALLMLPVVTRSAEVVLNLVPNSLREAALALGAPRWKVVFRIVLPTALPGLVTGSMLAIARGAGETAPLLFTAFAVNATSWNLGQQMNSLPIQIFNDVRQPQANIVERAWGAALTLVVMVLILTLIARLVQRRSRLA
ncbi:phosphate ABC transporter permease PstA [Candidatus Solirubrobacter pratensis]|uniref:phosphate ABC transporter permease PstA n=1 Tax=Candidatus Solirubrobacter pratensis TaxID=1298857 RepID=UPI0003FECADD|nr:phosphate ABC transporter permease PstA [Candidatus Solirubrobacter pratensis]